MVHQLSCANKIGAKKWVCALHFHLKLIAIFQNGALYCYLAYSGSPLLPRSCASRQERGFMPASKSRPQRFLRGDYMRDTAGCKASARKRSTSLGWARWLNDSPFSLVTTELMLCLLKEPLTSWEFCCDSVCLGVCPLEDKFFFLELEKDSVALYYIYSIFTFICYSSKMFLSFCWSSFQVQFYYTW